MFLGVFYMVFEYRKNLLSITNSREFTKFAILLNSYKKQKNKTKKNLK